MMPAMPTAEQQAQQTVMQIILLWQLAVGVRDFSRRLRLPQRSVKAVIARHRDSMTTGIQE